MEKYWKYWSNVLQDLKPPNLPCAGKYNKMKTYFALEVKHEVIPVNSSGGQLKNAVIAYQKTRNFGITLSFTVLVALGNLF